MLDADTRKLYFDLIQSHLAEAVRKALLMLPKGYVFQSEFAKEHIAQGRAEGQRAVLQKQLALKFGAAAATYEARLEAADDAQLSEWAERILSATTLDEPFADA